MTDKTVPDVPDSMQKIYRRFERWRSSHQGRLPEPVIERRTGWRWGEPRGEAKTIRRTGRTDRAKKCWGFQSLGGFASYYSKSKQA